MLCQLSQIIITLYSTKWSAYSSFLFFHDKKIYNSNFAIAPIPYLSFSFPATIFPSTREFWWSTISFVPLDVTSMGHGTDHEFSVIFRFDCGGLDFMFSWDSIVQNISFCPLTILNSFLYIHVFPFIVFFYICFMSYRFFSQQFVSPSFGLHSHYMI